MYGIYANIWGILMVNVTIYTIHGSYGYGLYMGFSNFPTQSIDGYLGFENHQPPRQLWSTDPCGSASPAVYRGESTGHLWKSTAYRGGRRWTRLGVNKPQNQFMTFVASFFDVFKYNILHTYTHIYIHIHIYIIFIFVFIYNLKTERPLPDSPESF